MMHFVRWSRLQGEPKPANAREGGPVRHMIVVYRVTTLPGSAFVIFPPSITGTPFTSTNCIPSES